MIRIVKYSKRYEDALFDLILSEGELWHEYSVKHKEQYIKALKSSKAYLIMKGMKSIAYIRVKDDHGFGLYIYDLLVGKEFRSHHYGKLLIDHVIKIYPNHDIYVMSDVDAYYTKLGYEKIGSIFKVIS
jgi:ribosomal protein S18 acetylase RimI-like enzyme